MKLILASTSPYRKTLLERLGTPFTCENPGVDEESFKNSILDPTKLVQTLAKEKARAIWQKNQDAFVIGGDQLAEIDNEILGKPGTTEKALIQLEKMSGKTHQLLTALHIMGPGHFDQSHLNVTLLKMRSLTSAELKRYISKDSPLDCAGSYKIEEHGINLFSEIRTEDMNAIMGLPLIWLQTTLLKAGFSFLG